MRLKPEKSSSLPHFAGVWLGHRPVTAAGGRPRQSGGGTAAIGIRLAKRKGLLNHIVWFSKPASSKFLYDRHHELVTNY